MSDGLWNGFLLWLFPRLCRHMRARGIGEIWMKLCVEGKDE